MEEDKKRSKTISRGKNKKEDLLLWENGQLPTSPPSHTHRNNGQIPPLRQTPISLIHRGELNWLHVTPIPLPPPPTQYSQSQDRGMDQITIKTPNSKCRHYWCLIEFRDWRYSQSCWYFRPLFQTSAPLPSLQFARSNTLCI